MLGSQDSHIERVLKGVEWEDKEINLLFLFLELDGTCVFSVSCLIPLEEIEKGNQEIVCCFYFWWQMEHGVCIFWRGGEISVSRKIFGLFFRILFLIHNFVCLWAFVDLFNGLKGFIENKMKFIHFPPSLLPSLVTSVAATLQEEETGEGHQEKFFNFYPLILLSSVIHYHHVSPWKVWIFPSVTHWHHLCRNNSLPCGISTWRTAKGLS